MRELHGVIYAGHPELDLKRRALLFDKFHIWDFHDEQFERSAELLGELSFLQSAEIVVPAPPINQYDLGFAILPGPDSGKQLYAQLRYACQAEALTELGRAEAALAVVRDRTNRVYASKVNAGDALDVVPICEIDLPDTLLESNPSGKTNVIKITMQSMPTPGESSAWEDIIQFKTEASHKNWTFRRFLHTLASKNQTQDEVRDDIEWTISEYSKAMELHHIKASNSFVDVFVISPLEVAENLVKFNWSKIARGALSVQKRRIDLLEAEMKAPGRECAYVFDARKRFGRR